MADERGSALVLMPTAVLVVLLLGAIALDQAIVLQRQRELVAACQAGAGDAAAAAVDAGSFYGEGAPEPDLARAEAAARRSLAARGFDVPVHVSVHGGRLVVEARADAQLVFTPVLPGAPGRREVAARADARLARR